MKVSIDMSGFRTLAADLTKAGKVAERELTPIITKGAVNIKKQLRKEMLTSKSFGSVAAFITYDITVGADFVEAEIGPEARGAGFLENIAYFGTPRGGGTVKDPRGALEAEAPNVERYLTKLVEGLL